MPNPVTTGTTYAGTFAGKYLSASLLSAPTLDNGGITILPNVAYKQVLQNLSTGSIVANANCDFQTGGGVVTLTEKVLTTKELQVNIQLCKFDLMQTWQASEMGYSSYGAMPKSFDDFLIAHVSAKVASATETNIWSGSAGAGTFDSIKTLALNDASVIDVTGLTGVNLNASVIIAEMGKVVDAIPASLYGKEGLKLYVSQKVAKLYVRALGGFGASGLGANGINAQGTQWYTNGSLSFDGIPIFMANGLGADNMIATTTDNLFFGFGLLNDKNIVQTIDMSPIDGSLNYRVIMRYNAGVQIGVGSDVVLYGV
jgi:hypothetical protein